jgi:hypothetical protein
MWFWCADAATDPMIAAEAAAIEAFMLRFVYGERLWTRE